MAAVIMSWLEQPVYIEWARQKGILNPPTTATRFARPSCNIPVSAHKYWSVNKAGYSFFHKLLV
jgi:hypothetical protein